MAIKFLYEENNALLQDRSASLHHVNEGKAYTKTAFKDVLETKNLIIGAIFSCVFVICVVVAGLLMFPSRMIENLNRNDLWVTIVEMGFALLLLGVAIVFVVIAINQLKQYQVYNQLDVDSLYTAILSKGKLSKAFVWATKNHEYGIEVFYTIVGEETYHGRFITHSDTTLNPNDEIYVLRYLEYGIPL